MFHLSIGLGLWAEITRWWIPASLKYGLNLPLYSRLPSVLMSPGDPCLHMMLAWNHRVMFVESRHVTVPRSTHLLKVSTATMMSLVLLGAVGLIWTIVSRLHTVKGAPPFSQGFR